MTISKLIEKHKAKLNQDKHGFVETKHCDSTFLSGLIGSNKLIDTDLTKAHDKKWFRRPTDYPECYFCKESRSTISRDTLLGVYWWAHANNRTDVLEDIWNYAWKHFWRMGEGRYFGADTIMNPVMMSTLAQLLDKSWFSWISGKWNIAEEPKDYYINRLIALHIGLRRSAGSKMSEHDESTILELKKTFPDNPLFTWASGHHIAAKNQLVFSQPGISPIPSGVHSESEYIY